MKIFAPGYYEKFKCIADKCKNNCCIGWEIDIDDKSYAKYESLDSEVRERIIKTVESSDSQRFFKLSKNGRCKNLDNKGLCKIISELGEEYLCDICRLHPRYFNDLSYGREAGLGMVCEEAARIILEDDGLFSLHEIGENALLTPKIDYPEAKELRDEIVSLILQGGLSFEEKLARIEAAYGVSYSLHTEREWIALFASLEILDSAWYKLLKNAAKKAPASDLSEFNIYFERFLVYLVYRHVSAARSYENLLARLGFSLALVGITATVLKREKRVTKKRLFEVIRLLSSEIEYSEDNTDEIIFEYESSI